MMGIRFQLRQKMADRNAELIRAGDNRGMNQTRLVEETGLAKSTLWGLETGKHRRVDFITLDKLCRALNCAPGDLIVFDPATAEPPRGERNIRRGKRSA